MNCCAGTLALKIIELNELRTVTTDKQLNKIIEQITFVSGIARNFG